MKKFYLLLLSLSMGLSSVFADGVERTYTDVPAGGLLPLIIAHNHRSDYYWSIERHRLASAS